MSRAGNDPSNQLDLSAGVFIDPSLNPDPGLGGPVTATADLEPPQRIDAQGGWTFKAPDPVGAYAQVTCEYAQAGPNVGKLFAFGGLDGTGARTAAVRMWDPATDTWSAKAPVPVPVGVGISNYDSAVTVGSKIYLFGGVNTTGGTNVFNNTFIYDTASDTWSAGTPLPGPRFAPAVGWDGGDKIYVLGGATSTVIQTTTWEYTISMNSWVQKSPMLLPAYRYHGATDSILGEVHMYGSGVIGQMHTHLIYNYRTGSHRVGLPTPVAIMDPATAAIRGIDGTDLTIIQVVAGMGGPQTTHIHVTLPPSWASFPGNPGGEVNNTCGALYFNPAAPPGQAGYFSIVGGYNGITTVAYNQFVAWF